MSACTPCQQRVPVRYRYGSVNDEPYRRMTLRFDVDILNMHRAAMFPNAMAPYSKNINYVQQHCTVYVCI